MGELDLGDGRSLTMKVNGKFAEFLFDDNGSETFDVTTACEWADENGELRGITPECKVAITVYGVEK